MATKKQTNTIYKLFKNGEILITKGFVKDMYKTADMSAYALRHETAQAQHTADVTATAAAMFYKTGNTDLVQAIIDGHEVEEVWVVDEVKTHIVTQEDIDSDDIDNIIKYGFCEVGDVYEEELSGHVEYIVR